MTTLAVASFLRSLGLIPACIAAVSTVFRLISDKDTHLFEDLLPLRRNVLKIEAARCGEGDTCDPLEVRRLLWGELWVQFILEERIDNRRQSVALGIMA